MKPIRVSRRTAVVGVTMYDVGQLLEGLGAVLGLSDWSPGTEMEPEFAADGEKLHARLMVLMAEMDRIAGRLDAGATIDEARRR